MLKSIVTISILLILPFFSWAKKELTFTYWGSTFEKKAVEAVIGKFNEENPGVEVRAQHIPQNYNEKLMTMITAGNAPDIGYIQEEKVAQWSNEGIIKDLAPYFEGNDDLKSRVEVAWYRVGDRIIGTNAALETMIIFYNKKLFEEAGVETPPTKWTEAWTWDEFVQVAKKLTKDKNGNNALSPNFDKDNIDVYGFSHDTWWGHWYPMIHSNNGRIVSEDGMTLMLDQPEATEAIQALADLSWKHHVAPTPAAIKSLPSGPIMLKTGKVAMRMDGHWNILDVSQMGFDWGLGVLPYHQKPVTVSFGGALGIFESTKHPEVALKLYMFLGDPDKNDLFPKGLWMPMRIKDYIEPSITANWLDKYPGVYPPESRDVLVDYTIMSIQSAPFQSPSYWVKGWAGKAYPKVVQPQLDLVFTNEATAVEAMKEAAKLANPMLTGRLWPK